MTDSDYERQFTTLYLGYSSNLSPTTMKQRCPGSLYIGVAKLQDYKWIINSTSYATIIPSPGDIVYGSLYFLTARDEAALDTSEGVPWLYEKQYLPVKRLVRNAETGLMVEESEEVKALTYVDVQRLEEGVIEPDYVVWVMKAIRDGIVEGIPEEYMEKYLRVWVGEQGREMDVMMVRTLPGVWSNAKGSVRGRVMGDLNRG